MKIHTCTQLSAEWFELRRGVPTASQFGRIMTPRGRLAARANEYICELIAEQHHLGPIHDLGPKPNRAMLHGTECESEARSFYCLERGVDVKQVGFCTTDDGRFGCSPDGLIGNEGDEYLIGGLELKCPQGKTQVQYLLEDELPREYMAQVHGQLIVTGAAWVDFLSYAPGLPALLIRVTPDDCTKALRENLERFWERFQLLKSKIGGTR